MQPNLKILSQQNIEDIHRGTMAVLSEVGVDFHLPRAVELFKAHGFKTEGRRVFFTEDQLMEQVKKAPRTFTMLARNPDKNVEVGKNPLFGAGTGYINIITPECRRPTVFTDVVNIFKLVETFDEIFLNGMWPVTPVDMASGPSLAHTMLFGHLLSDKVMGGLGFGGEYAKLSVEMAKIVFGDIQDKPYLLGLVNPTSPLMWVEEVLNSVFIYAEAGQPIEFGPAGMLGTTMPVTSAGGIVTTTAELLAGVVLIQLIKEGLPVIPGTTSSSTDMRSMALAMGAPEYAIMGAAICQIMDYYGLPARSGGLVCDALDNDVQSASESCFNFIIPAMAGASMSFHIGMCEGYISFSYEKFMTDMELVKMTQFFLKGIDTEEGDLATSVIKDVGPGGSFLNHKHTFNRFRSGLYAPYLMNRQSYATWEKRGKESVNMKAKKAWQERVENYQAPDLDPTVAKDLWAYVHNRFGVTDTITPDMVSAGVL